MSRQNLNPETQTPYTRAELEAAFALVKPTPNWKDPIRAVVPGRPGPVHLDVIREAVIFFTGSVPAFSQVKGGVSVVADGYYLAVGP